VERGSNAPSHSGLQCRSVCVCVCAGQFVMAVHAGCWLTDTQATVCIHSPCTDAAGQIRMFQSTVTVTKTENLSSRKKRNWVKQFYGCKRAGVSK